MSVEGNATYLPFSVKTHHPKHLYKTHRFRIYQMLCFAKPITAIALATIYSNYTHIILGEKIVSYGSQTDGVRTILLNGEEEERKRK